MGKHKSLVGIRRGRLTIMERLPDKINKVGVAMVQWRCLCDCGNTVDRSTSHIGVNGTKSCGCLQKEAASKSATSLRNARRAKASPVQQLYKRYLRGASARGHEFNITLSRFEEFTKMPCHYCGIQSGAMYRGKFAYTGVDRKDNKEGYTEANCVPCCFKCNKCKNVLSYSDFLDTISKVYLRRCA